MSWDANVRLDGKVAIVTGGGRGIGEATAIVLARAGCRVMLAARTQAELERVAALCREAGGEAAVRVTDVLGQGAARSLVAETVARWGRLDILVNAAGTYGPIGRFQDDDLDEWIAALNVNLVGTLTCCHAAIPHLAKQGGKIINYSGGGATAPLPRFSAYGTSKAAVVRFTETLAEELRDQNIQVNVIAPGAVDTKLQDAVLEAGERAGDIYPRMVRMRETGAGGTPVEVPAGLGLFLASAASDGLTGRLIAAPHDGWEQWTPERIAALDGTPWFTLRRIDPFTIAPLAGKTP